VKPDLGPFDNGQYNILSMTGTMTHFGIYALLMMTVWTGSSHSAYDM